jgi:hypothetical protein
VKWEAGVKRGKVSSSFPLNSIFHSFSLTRIHRFYSIARSDVVPCALVPGLTLGVRFGKYTKSSTQT